MTDMFFAPTNLSRDNLLKENIPGDKIYVTGNTAIDAMQTTVEADYHHEVLDWVGEDRMILLTAHRRENLGEPMKRIFRAIRRVLDEVPDIKVVYPIHKNPLVRAAAEEELAHLFVQRHLRDQLCRIQLFGARRRGRQGSFYLLFFSHIRAAGGERQQQRDYQQ